MTEVKTCGCGRPVAEDEVMCEYHAVRWDARADLEDLQLAEKMIVQFDGILAELCCGPLTEAMKEARERVVAQRKGAEERLLELAR